MTIMHILVEELLCQAVAGQILLLESLLSGACGCLRLCPFKPDIKCHCFQRTRLQGNLPGTREPQAWPLGARVYAEPGCEDKASWADRWQNPTHPWLRRWGKGLV
jgi:hypothetical protein